jgi:hypothetical protein
LAYTKLDDIKFKDEYSKELATRLYKDIQFMEKQLVANEELLSSLVQSVGEKQANFIAGILVLRDKKILAGLKIAFFYYTGHLSDKVIADLDSEEEVDIFNPR